MKNIEDFIARWKKSSAAERSNFQSFMSELCDTLGVRRPDPATENESENAYVFARNVRFQHGDGTQTTGRIDLYKRGCFVLEGKQSKKREEDPRAREAKQLGLALGEASTRTGSGKRVEDRVAELLQIMAAIGQAQTENGSRYFAPR